MSAERVISTVPLWAYTALVVIVGLITRWL